MLRIVKGRGGPGTAPCNPTILGGEIMGTFSNLNLIILWYLYLQNITKTKNIPVTKRSPLGTVTKSSLNKMFLNTSSNLNSLSLTYQAQRGRLKAGHASLDSYTFEYFADDRCEKTIVLNQTRMMGDPTFNVCKTKRRVSRDQRGRQKVNRQAKENECRKQATNNK